MAIAADPRIANRTHGSALPPAWRTLYELNRLDGATFKAAAGGNTPDMERADVLRLRARARRGRGHRHGDERTRTRDTWFGHSGSGLYRALRTG